MTRPRLKSVDGRLLQEQRPLGRYIRQQNPWLGHPPSWRVVFVRGFIAGFLAAALIAYLVKG